MKPLTLEETALKEEMKERCLAKGQYIDEKAKDKFKMLCHLEDFEIQYWELLKENKKLKECYCNRTDCSGRIKNSRKYDSLYQKYKSSSNNSCLTKEKNIVGKNLLEGTYFDCNGIPKMIGITKAEYLEYKKLQQENKELENKIKRLEEIIQWYEKENRHNQEIIIDLSKRIDKTTQAIDELLSYDDFKDITNANFGNVKEELKFYLSNYKTLEDFRKEIINNEK